VLRALSFKLAHKEKPIMTPKRLMQAVVLARGWRRAWIAFIAGAASALCQAPINLWPILFLTFPLLVWLIDGAKAQRRRGAWVCALTGWCFGFGYFVAGLYWIGHAFLVDAETFGWLLPVAVTGLPAYLAIYTAIGFAAARLLWTPGPVRILAFAVVMTAAEWLRGHALTGFPWNSFGYALMSPLELAQAASLVGIWGLTFLAFAVFASPATLTDERSDTTRPWLPALCALAVLAALALFGSWRLSRTPTSPVDGVELRIMQPNLQQDSKFNYSAKAQVMSRYIGLSNRETDLRPRGLRDVTHLIWPESAFPFYLNTEPDAIAQIAALLPEGTVLITGSDRTGPPPPSAASADTHTSIYVIDHRGSVRALYDKVHLVPFGEFLPFQYLLERVGLQQLTKVAGGIVAGERRQSMPVPGAPPALPLLCYEVIFADEMTARGERPGWLLNLTNDGWFGISSGPYQHFAQARLRAIEQGLPLVRAANTGISAVVDPLGRIIRSLPLGTEGLLDAPLPQAIAPTLYSRFGDGPAGLWLAAALVVVVRRRIWDRPAEQTPSKQRS
jgi:apolipoprotein N-acyltransferase